MKNIEIYTDGACKGNPGPGGWGTILKYGDTEKELSGGESMTTNNRMELTAVIEGLKALKEPCNVIVTTDSKYVADAINKCWLDNWIKINFKGKKNVELWKELIPLIKEHKVKFNWIKGHAGHPYNERCDTLAVNKAKYYKNSN